MKIIKTKTIFSIAILSTLLLLMGTLRVLAQVPTHQDCFNAIPICGNTYVENTTYSNTGNYTNEIDPSISACSPGFSETNSSWYIVTCQTTGTLAFTLTPANPAANFDFAVYNMSGTATCNQILTNNTLEVACNTDATPGQTGLCGGIGPQYSPPITVTTSGTTYVICVSNVSGTAGGFTLDFSCSTAQVIDNVPAHMTTVQGPVSCNATTIKVHFSENVLCSTVTPAVFYITDALNVTYTVTAVASTNCGIGSNYDNYYTLTFNPALTHAGTYTLHLTGSVTDQCGNISAAGQVNFNIAGVTVQAHHTAAGCGCTARDSIHVLTGTAPFTYAWTCSPSTLATISGLCANTICTCTVHGVSGCPGIVIDTIPSGNSFTLTRSTVNTSCTANTGEACVSMNGGTGPYTFNWSPNVGTDSCVSNLAAGIYSVTVTDVGAGCTAVAVDTVSSAVAMTATAIGSNVNCANATNGNVHVNVVGFSAYSFLWSPSGATTSIVNHLAAGNYTVTVTDIVTGCTVTATCTIAIVTGMTLTTGSNSVCCATAHNGVVWVTASGFSPNYPYHYIWSPSNATTNTVSNLTPSTYNVSVTDTNGCVVTAAVTIAVSAGMTNTQTINNPSCSGLGSCQASPSGCSGNNFTYHWTGNQTTPTITNLAAGTYTVTITDVPSGCTISSTYTLTLTSNLTVTMHSTNVQCNGGATGSAWETIGNGTGPYTYVWTPSGGNASTANNLGIGNYTVTVTQTGGCSVIGYITITQPSALILAMSSTSSTCGQSNGSAIATPDSGTGPYTYIWSTAPAQHSATATNLNSGTYICTVTDANGCTIMDSVSFGSAAGPSASITAHTNVSCFGGADGTANATGIGGTAPYSYAWSSAPVQLTQNAANLPIGLYTVVVSDVTGCTATDTVTIKQPTALTLVVGGASTECVGQTSLITAIANGGSGGYNYTWSNGGIGSPLSVAPLITTAYTCTATDMNGCSSPAESITINVLSPISVVAFGPSDSICAGKNASIIATASGGNSGPYSYTWTPGGLTGNPVAVSPTVTTTYTCSVSDGCTTIPGTTVVKVNVIPLPNLNFSVSPVVGCEPLEVTFTDLSLNIQQGSSYFWSFGGIGSDTATNPTFTMTQSGLYNVSLRVTSPQGCIAMITDTNAIDVFPKPKAIITADPLLTTKSNAIINFFNSSVNANFYDWNFGDPLTTTSTLKNPTFSYLDTGIFTASLIAVNLYGCADTAYINIFIKEDFTFYIPSAFSPDNDGLNDFFTPTGLGITDYVMYIFDRFGNQIFQTNDLSIPWDGKISGKDAPENVYVYWIQNIDRDGNKHTYTGKVTLLR